MLMTVALSKELQATKRNLIYSYVFIALPILISETSLQALIVLHISDNFYVLSPIYIYEELCQKRLLLRHKVPNANTVSILKFSMQLKPKSSLIVLSGEVVLIKFFANLGTRALEHSIQISLENLI